MGEQSNRHEAAKAGSTTYVPEKPCTICETSLRYTSNGGCVQCVKARSAANTEAIREALRKARAEG